MSTIPVPKSNLNYYAKLRNKQKNNQQGQTQIQQQHIIQTKQILGGEADYDNLFAHMNKDNLNYIKNQIKQKQKKKIHQRAKSSVPELQGESIIKQDRKTHRQVNYQRQNLIQQSEPYQQQTERFSNQKNSPDKYELSPKYFKDAEEQVSILPVQTNEKQDEEQYEQSQFVNFLGDYIQSLKKRSNKNRKIQISSMLLKKTPKKQRGQKQNNLDEQILRKKIYNLEKKYEKQKKDNAYLAKQLQDRKRIEEIHKQTILKLQQKNINLIRQTERLKLRFSNFQPKQYPSKKHQYQYLDLVSPYTEKYQNLKYDRLKEKDRPYSRKSSYNSLEKIQQQYKQFIRLNGQLLKRPENGFYIKK